MTLLITAFAAVITTIVWYSSEKSRNLKIGTLALAYWGASLMWLVDAFVEYTEIEVKQNILFLKLLICLTIHFSDFRLLFWDL